MKATIKKYLTGKGTGDDHRQLLDWIREDDHLKDFYEIRNAWESDIFQSEMPADSQKSWSSLQNQLLIATQRKLQKSTRYLRFFKYAAVLIFAVFIATDGARLIGVGAGIDQLHYSTVKADAGQIANVILPDQTEVWLNSGSYIRYNNEFASSNREIELVGEAYFNVTKNATLPLLVSGSPIQVKVLGTKFNVSAYPEDHSFNVILEEGKVELISDRYKNFREEIKPNYLAVFNKESKQLDIRKVNVEHYTSWKNGMVNIYNLPLEKVVIKLSKRYNQQFEIDEEVKQLRYTYTIKNEPLSDILNLMETITPIEVIQKGDVIRLKYNRQKNK